MVEVTITSRGGETRTLTAETGTSFKDAILTAGFPDVVGLCGGFASCGTCQVHLAEGWAERLPPPDDMEEMLLEGSRYRQPNSRLSCQIRLDDSLNGLTATLSPEE